MVKYKFSDIAYNITAKKKPVSGDEKTYIGLEHLDTGNLDVTRWGSDVELTGEKLQMQKGDILFGRRNTYLRRAAIAPHDGIFSAHGMIFRPKTEVVNADYFPFFIASDYFMDEAIRISVGSLSPTVNWGTLKELEFELPPLEKQKELAEILWAGERTRQAYKKLLQKTDEVVKAKFEEMFLCNVTYEKKTLATVSEVIAGGDKPKETSENCTEEYCYPVYANGIHNEGLQCYARDFRVNKAAVTISARGTIGVSFIRKPYFTPIVRLITIIPSKELNVTYLKFAIDSTGVNSTGSSQQQLTVPNVKQIAIVIPPIYIQELFENIYIQAEQTKQQLQKSLDSLNSVMRSLVNQNFNKGE